VSNIGKGPLEPCAPAPERTPKPSTGGELWDKLQAALGEVEALQADLANARRAIKLQAHAILALQGEPEPLPSGLARVWNLDELLKREGGQ